MTRILKAVIASVLTSFVASAQSSKDNAVVRLDPALDALVSPDAKVELVKGGFGFTEGPVWVQNGGGGDLLFTHNPPHMGLEGTPHSRAAGYLTKVGSK